MAGQLALVEPTLGGQAAPLTDGADDSRGMAWPAPLVTYSAREKCFNGPCPGMVKFEFGCGFCEVCGVAQIVVD